MIIAVTKKYIVNVLLSTSMILLAGCTKEESSITVTSRTPIVELQNLQTLSWDDRADYENEGNQVIFRDCGFYTASGELSGATCEFNLGKWILLNPMPEPTDNLIQNSMFSMWANGPGPISTSKIADQFTLWPPNHSSGTYVKAATDSFISDPYALYVNSKGGDGLAVISQTLPNLLKENTEKHYTIIYYSRLIIKDESKYKKAKIILEVNMPESNNYIEVADVPFSQDWIYASHVTDIIKGTLTGVHIRLEGSSELYLDDIELYLGVFPMVIEHLSL